MTKKPTYKELEQRVKELEKKAVKGDQRKESQEYTLKRLREILSGVVQTIAMTVEVRDPYSAGHQRRVANLARYIATEMKLYEDQIEGIRIAGIIHDLGKVSIPAEILSKPSRLNDMEFAIIKTHCQIGYDIMKEIEFPWPIAQIVHQHHERMDGSGYPLGISGEEISIEASIIAVADTVEAMATHRPYRPALGIKKALKEIFLKREELYDPKVVDSCMRLFIDEGFEF